MFGDIQSKEQFKTLKFIVDVNFYTFKKLGKSTYIHNVRRILTIPKCTDTMLFNFVELS